MATLHHDHAEHGTIYLKGAPEKVLALCDSPHHADGEAPLDLDAWHARMHDAAADGMRLLAVARRRGRLSTLEFDDVKSGGFTLLAVLALSDPPREEAIRAVAACRAAGIRVKMIPGDHAATAQAIGRQLGLGEADRTLVGADIERMELVVKRDAPLMFELLRFVGTSAFAVPVPVASVKRALMVLGHTGPSRWLPRVLRMASASLTTWCLWPGAQAPWARSSAVGAAAAT